MSMSEYFKNNGSFIGAKPLALNKLQLSPFMGHFLAGNTRVHFIMGRRRRLMDTVH